MDKWVAYALVSMVFSGFTSVIAKMGLAGISGELSLTVRTLFVSFFVLGFAAIAVPMNDYSLLNRTNILWLGLSASSLDGAVRNPGFSWLRCPVFRFTSYGLRICLLKLVHGKHAPSHGAGA
jgi:uncharacterized membrane protein